jgi:hypothetical protein
MLFLKVHEQRFVPLVHAFHKQFRNRPQSLSCNSQFLSFVPHHSSAFLWVIRRMVLATQLNAVLYAGLKLLATVSLTSDYVLADSPDQINRYLGSRV